MRRLVLASVAVVTVVAASLLAPTQPAYAKRFKATVSFSVSGGDFGPEGTIPTPPAVIRAAPGPFGGGSVSDVPYRFTSVSKTFKKIRYSFSFGLPDIDWSAQQLPYTFDTLSCSLGVDRLNGGVPDMLGYWSRNPQGASAQITVTSYTPKTRRIRGTITGDLRDGLVTLDLQPVTLTGSFDAKLPK